MKPGPNPFESVSYAMAQPEDLDGTVNLVEKTGRRIVAEHADVRDFRQLQSVVDAGEKVCCDTATEA